MILIMRIVGQAAIKKNFVETLKRLNIHRKLACTLISKDDAVRMGMLKNAANLVSYREISDDLVKKIIVARGQTLMGKPISEKDAEKALADIKKGEWKIKRFFRLHPPRGGFKKSTKIQAPKGVLGENKDIAKLVERML